MDRTVLSDESIHEVGTLFEAALRAVAAELSTDDRASLERRLQAVGRAVVGQVVERVLAVRAAGDGVERRPCAHCGGALRRVGRARERHIQGVVGDDTIHRADDLCTTCRHGQAPLDVRMGRGPGTLAPTLLGAVCRLGIATSCVRAASAARTGAAPCTHTRSTYTRSFLDWAQAVGYLDAAAQAAYGAGTVWAQTWLPRSATS